MKDTNVLFWPPVILAQIIAEDAIGMSGWPSFGIAGLVLGWLLLRHLPAKDQQIERIMETHSKRISDKDEQIAKMVETHSAIVKDLSSLNEKRTEAIISNGHEALSEQRSEFKSMIASIVKVHDAAIGELKEATEANAKEVRESVTNLHRYIGEISGKLIQADSKNEN